MSAVAMERRDRRRGEQARGHWSPRISPRCMRRSTISGSSCSRAFARASTSTSTRPESRTVTRATTLRSGPRPSAYAEADGKLDALAKELDPSTVGPSGRRRARPCPVRDVAPGRGRRRHGARPAALVARAASSQKPAQTFSLLQGLWMISGAGGTYELFEPDQCLAYRVVGGSQLPIRLAERLGDRVLSVRRRGTSGGRRKASRSKRSPCGRERGP